MSREASRAEGLAMDATRARQLLGGDLRQIFRIQYDLDPPVGGPPLFRVIALDGMGIRVSDGREGLRLDSSLVDQEAHDGRRARGGELPIGFELVLKLRADRDVVGMALDPDLFIRNFV